MQDFLQCLPFPEYSHPEGCLNVAHYLSQDLVKPDLGPKSYIATGRSTTLPPSWPLPAAAKWVIFSSLLLMYEQIKAFLKGAVCDW